MVTGIISTVDAKIKLLEQLRKSVVVDVVNVLGSTQIYSNTLGSWEKISVCKGQHQRKNDSCDFTKQKYYQ